MRLLLTLLILFPSVLWAQAAVLQCQYLVEEDKTRYSISIARAGAAARSDSDPDETGEARQASERLLDVLNEEQPVCSNIEQSTVRLSGTVELQSNRTIEADVVIFEADTRLISHGFDLIVLAGQELHIGKGAQIVSFTEAVPERQNKHGRNAGLVSIRAGRVEGDVLHIANHGQDGLSGQAGADGAPGKRGSPGRPGVNQGVRGCTGQQAPGRGGQGGSGQKGGRGGDAGDGGSVTLQIARREFEGSYDHFKIEQSRINPFTGELYRCRGSCPGVPGPGGRGGQGGPGGPGGISLRGRWPCIGGGIAPAGKPGKDGKQGKPGKHGEAGSVLIL